MKKVCDRLFFKSIFCNYFLLKDLQDLARKLQNELNETKNEITRILEVKYNFESDFKPLLNKCEKYEKQIDYFNNQINLVKNEIKEKVLLLEKSLISYINFFFHYLKQVLIENSHDVEEYKHLVENIEAFNNAIKLLELLKEFDDNLNGSLMVNLTIIKKTLKCYFFFKRFQMK